MFEWVGVSFCKYVSIIMTLILMILLYSCIPTWCENACISLTVMYFRTMRVSWKSLQHRPFSTRHSGMWSCALIGCIQFEYMMFPSQPHSEMVLRQMSVYWWCSSKQQQTRRSHGLVWSCIEPQQISKGALRHMWRRRLRMTLPTCMHISNFWRPLAFMHWLT